jgi:hypothetical protein
MFKTKKIIVIFQDSIIIANPGMYVNLAAAQDFSILGAFFLSKDGQKKPGFPLQVLGSANALPVGFPLQSLARSAAQNQTTQLPQAIAWAHNCLAIMRVQLRRSQFVEQIA